MRRVFWAHHAEGVSSYIIRSENTEGRILILYDLPEVTIDEFIAVANEVGDDAWSHFEVRQDRTDSDGVGAVVMKPAAWSGASVKLDDR
ncbi:hypothetical protein GGR54DRAFT_638558 [Hypoxylon sp. NC1633]|nr:hypothetical protein GGR54DRAFT_638558 [Hypoxylon sp. NC1633]